MRSSRIHERNQDRDAMADHGRDSQLTPMNAITQESKESMVNNFQQALRGSDGFDGQTMHRGHPGQVGSLGISGGLAWNRATVKETSGSSTTNRGVPQSSDEGTPQPSDLQPRGPSATPRVSRDYTGATGSAATTVLYCHSGNSFCDTVVRTVIDGYDERYERGEGDEMEFNDDAIDNRVDIHSKEFEAENHLRRVGCDTGHSVTGSRPPKDATSRNSQDDDYDTDDDHGLVDDDQYDFDKYYNYYYDYYYNKTRDTTRAFESSHNRSHQYSYTRQNHINHDRGKRISPYSNRDSSSTSDGYEDFHLSNGYHFIDDGVSSDTDSYGISSVARKRVEDGVGRVGTDRQGSVFNEGYCVFDGNVTGYYNPINSKRFYLDVLVAWPISRSTRLSDTGHIGGGENADQANVIGGDASYTSTPTSPTAVNNPSYATVTSNQQEELMKNYVIHVGPVTTLVDGRSWQFYSGVGVFRGCPRTRHPDPMPLSNLKKKTRSEKSINSDSRSEQETWGVQEAEEAWEWGSVAADRTGMNLAVQVVGVNLLDQYNSYWIVRTSFGEDYGDHGNIYLPYMENSCGLGSFPAFIFSEDQRNRTGLMVFNQ
eukprot:gene1111-1251_t